MYINVYEFIADMRFYDFCCQTLDGGLKSTSLTGLGLMELHQCCTIRTGWVCYFFFLITHLSTALSCSCLIASRVKPNTTDTPLCMLENVWYNMPTYGLLVQWNSTKYPTKRVGLIFSRHHHYFIECMFSPWYSWRIAHLALNNNHSPRIFG